jgi:exopolyphosphatase/guanosine-5'-triphosphate,3'-diphosphate pyrophosphatase
MIEAELDRAFSIEPRFEAAIGRIRLIGLAGTVATLTQLDQGLAAYSRAALHHHNISYESVLKWRDRLSAISPDERLALPGMVPGREDVLHAGLYILEAVMRRFEVSNLLSSENDILDGVVASLLP